MKIVVTCIHTHTHTPHILPAVLLAVFKKEQRRIKSSEKYCSKETCLMSLAYSKRIGPWVPLPSSFGVIFGLWNIFRTRRCGCPRYFCVASVLTGLCLSCSFFQCKVYLHIFNLPFFIFFVPYFRIAYAQFSCSFLSGLLFALSRSSRLLNSVQSLKR